MRRARCLLEDRGRSESGRQAGRQAQQEAHGPRRRQAQARAEQSAKAKPSGQTHDTQAMPSSSSSRARLGGLAEAASHPASSRGGAERSPRGPMVVAACTRHILPTRRKADYDVCQAHGSSSSRPRFLAAAHMSECGPLLFFPVERRFDSSGKTMCEVEYKREIDVEN